MWALKSLAGVPPGRILLLWPCIRATTDSMGHLVGGGGRQSRPDRGHPHTHVSWCLLGAAVSAAALSARGCEDCRECIVCITEPVVGCLVKWLGLRYAACATLGPAKCSLVVPP